MNEARRFRIGAHVRCTDGPVGELTRVVIDPIARAVTHVVVEPRHRQGDGRLVDVELVDRVADDVELSCTRADFARLDHAEETHFLPSTRGYLDYSGIETLCWPYYGLGMGIGGATGSGIAGGPERVVVDSIPVGEVAVRRGQPVHARDGDIGHVQGLVIDAATHGVTHLLLQEGHLWGRKEVAIPINVVKTVENRILLDLTKREVADLPHVDVVDPESEG